VEGQARSGKAEGLRNLPGGHTNIPRRHKHADQIKPSFMGQGRKGRLDLGAIHFTLLRRSTIQELLN